MACGGQTTFHAMTMTTDDSHEQGKMLMTPWKELDGRLIVGTVVLLSFLAFVAKRREWVIRVNRLPGPSKCHWLLGHLDGLFASLGTIPGYPQIPRSEEWFRKLVQDFQDFGLLRIWAFNPYWLPFSRTLVLIFDPHLVKQLLESPQASARLMKEPRVFGAASAIIGDSMLVLSDTPEWKHVRKLSAPAFHASVLEEANQVAAKLLQDVIYPCFVKRGGVAVEALELTTRLTAEVLGIIAFSYSFGGLGVYQNDDKTNTEQGDTLYDAYQVLLFTVTKQLRMPGTKYIQYLPTSENRRYNKAAKLLADVVGDVVKDRLREETRTEEGNGQDQVVAGTKHKDLLAQLLREDEHGERLPFYTIFANVRMFLFAGHDTTANTLAFLLWDLATNQVVQSKLREEVDALFHSSSGEETIPTYKQLQSLRYLDAVVKEALRLHASAGVSRMSKQEICLTTKKDQTTYRIPPGASIYFFPCFTHTNENEWERAVEFIPERHFDNSEKGAWLPFSIGPRDCLGKPLAMVELKTIVAHMVRKFVVKRNKDAIEPIPMMLLTVKPHQVLLDLVPRTNI
jgi:cytochrome P450